MAHEKEYYYLMRMNAACIDKEVLDALGDDILGLARLPYNWAEGAVIGSVIYEPISKAEFETYKEFEITTEVPFTLHERK